MAKVVGKTFATFNSGEQDPALLGRFDTAEFFKGVAKARNCYSLVTGGMVRRPGTEFVDDLQFNAPPAGDARARFIPYVDGGVDSVTGKATGALIVLNHNLISVYSVPGLVRITGFGGAWLSTQLDQVTWTQQAGGQNIIIFHPNLQPRRISIATGTWALSTLSFESIPQHHFEDTTGGSVVSHVERVHLINFGAGPPVDRFTLFVDGVETGWIDFDAATATVAANIKAAIESLPNISAGGGGDVTVVHDTNQVYKITLAGTVDGRRFFFTPGNIDELTAVVNDVVLVYTDTQGSLKKEDIWSGSTGTGAEGDRGWPRCGAFFGNRLFMAGSPALPNAVWGSRVSNAEDFILLDDPTDGSPILYFEDTDQGATFNQVFVGRHLQFFASNTEFYAPKSDSEPLTPSNFTLRAASSIGAMRGAPPLFLAGSTIYLQRDGRGLRRFIFDEAEQNYRSFDISIRGGHLLNVTPDAKFSGGLAPILHELPINEMALQRSRDSENPDRIYIVNEAGNLICVVFNEDEGVLGWHQWETKGLFTNVVVVGDDVFVGVYREDDLSVGAVKDAHFIERFDDRLLLDSAAFDFAPTPGDAVSSDMTYLEADTGETNTVEKIVDGVTQGTQDFTETETIANFDPAAQTDWQVGLSFPDVKGDGSQVWIKTLPVEIEALQRILMGENVKIAGVTLRLIDTGSIVVDGHNLPLSDWIEAGDLTLHRKTGDFKTESLEDIDGFGQIDITQSKSDHLHLLAVKLKVELLGD